MSKLGRAGLALVLVTVLVPLAGVAAGASVSAKQKPVSEAKYARSVCSAYTNLIQEIEDYTTSYKATSNEPVQFQTEVVALTNDLVAKITLDQAKVKKVYPDVDDGKKIAKLFANNLAEIKSEISGALAKFQAADANGVAFQADVAQFEVAINLLSVKTSDPFSKVTDQDVIGAFDDEKACKTVVNVYGG